MGELAADLPADHGGLLVADDKPREPATDGPW